MRIVPIAGRTGRSVALALAVALAAGCDTEPDATDTADLADTRGPLPPPPQEPGDQGDQGDAGDASDASDASDPTVPSRFQGSYAADQAACDAAGNPTRLTIGDDSISFHESTGPITDIDSGPAEVTITAELTGEGETREATYTFRLSDDDGTLTDVAGGLERVRCN